MRTSRSRLNNGKADALLPLTLSSKCTASKGLLEGNFHTLPDSSRSRSEIVLDRQ